MMNKVVQFNFGSVIFFKNKRSRTIRLRVKPDKSVVVSYPWFVSSKEASAFVIKNEKWIHDQLLKFESNVSKHEEGSVINTKLHSVVFVKGDKNQLRASGNIVNLFLKDFDSAESQLFKENAITHIYRYEAKKLLPERLTLLAVKYGFTYSKVSIRNNRRNWGSCSFKNNISLNLQMMKLPDELIDYILLHELVHTVVKNHGPEFWKKLDSITNYRAKELAKQVKKYSTYTL